MATYKCNACGATFTTPQADGSGYFHVCPPLGVAELIAASDAGAAFITPAIAADVALAKGPASVDPAKPGPAELAHERLARVFIERPGHVNQNVQRLPPRASDDKSPVPILSAGAGVTKEAD